MCTVSVSELHDPAHNAKAWRLHCSGPCTPLLWTIAIATLALVLGALRTYCNADATRRVTPALSPPSPVAPSNALRGLYLLATAIATLIGAALGIFFYTFTKYWVGAAGGFAFGWFLLALRKGGLVGQSVGGRWGIVGGLTVIAFLLTLVPKCHETVLLISSAWIGATAFTLGVDCFTRAGLKEVS